MIDLVAELGRQEVVADLVAVVHRPRRVEPHRHRLGADRERAHEDVEVLERGLQVHHPLARLVVARAQLLGRADARDADPLAAVERLHEERVADVAADRLEVERRVVALGGRLEARVLRRHLVRDQPRLGHADAEPHQRAVRGVLLHRLERERVVQQVDVVHQRDLLQPGARQVVPPREPVDHERVARPVAQVERLVDDPLGAQLVAVDRAEPRDERLERGGPVLLGAEQQADHVLRSSDEPRQMVRDLAPPRRPVVRDVVAPEVDLVPECPSRRAARRSGCVESSAPVVSSHCPWPQTRTSEACASQPVEMVAVEVRDVVHRVVEVDRFAALAATLDGHVVDAAHPDREREEVGALEAEVRPRGRRRTTRRPRSARACASRPGRTARARVSTHHS